MGSLRYGVIGLLMAVASCSDKTPHQVSFTEHKDGFSLTIRSEHIKGLCYSPTSFYPNGHLEVEGINLDHPVAFKRVSPSNVEGERAIVSQGEVKILENQVQVEIPRDSVVKRPFHIQLLLFECKGAAPENQRQLFVLSAAVDLPLS